jgi:serine/threonine-protein kinase
MATVYRARDLSLERDVALKVLPAEFLHDAAFAERFKQEARVAARLEHPHIVPVHAFGIEQGAPWMAMRLVTGGSLADRVRRGPLAPREVAALLADVAGALDYAHKRGVVHRDVKPANVLLDEAGRGYLADFGVARMLEGSAVTTATGMIQGTPSYMAPEQAMGEKVDRLADVYALGIVAFECLTGRVPYTGTTPVAILMKHVQEPVPEPTAAEVTAPISAVLRRCLAKARAERWPSAGAFAKALSEAAERALAADLDSLPTLEVPRAPDGDTPGTRTLATAVTTHPPTRRTLAWAAGGGLVGLVVLAAAGALLLSRVWPSGPPPPAPSVAPASRPPASSAPEPARRPIAAPADVPRATPRPRVPEPTPTPTPEAAVSGPVLPKETAKAEEPVRDAPVAPVAPARSGPVRVFCEGKLEPIQFRKTGAKDVADSLKDLREAIAKREGLQLVATREEAEAVVQVLERGREPAVIGMRKVRVRILLGRESVELLGQDSMTGFNTWSGAAGGASKQVEAWLARHVR